jgi:hypothetical protein
LEGTAQLDIDRKAKTIQVKRVLLHHTFLVRYGLC